MRAAVRQQFDLNQPAEDGRPLREHLESAERLTGRRPDRLATPPIPGCFQRQLEIWSRLHLRRQASMGLSPISWQDIMAYCVLTGERLSPTDMQVLDIIEGEFFASYAEAQKKRMPAK